MGQGDQTLVSDYIDVSPIGDVSSLNSSTQLIIYVAWVITLLLSISLGLASIIYEWSGIPIHLGGMDLNITIYPPLIFCTFWVFWLGFWWGFIPAYLSTLVLALYSGMPFSWSLMFAFADPLGLAVMAMVYRAIPVAFDMKTINSVVVFCAVAFISGIIGSTGSFIWSYTNSISISEVYPIWQGWWLGAFLQNVVIVAPVLALFTSAVLKWRGKALQREHLCSQVNQTKILRMSAVILVGLLIYVYSSIKLGVIQLEAALEQGNLQGISDAAATFSESTTLLFFVIAAIIFTASFFALKVFSYWIQSLNESAEKLRISNRELEKLSKYDSLTGLYNRRAWEVLIDNEFKRCIREKCTSTLLLLDIDFFKRVNDTYGHQVGDDVIRMVSKSLQDIKRESDIAGRYGGEEILVVLPHTDIPGALYLAERIRHKISSTPITYKGEKIFVTVSLGLAALRTGFSGYHQWITEADRALYQAKLSGRNQTVVYRPADEEKNAVASL